MKVYLQRYGVAGFLLVYWSLSFVNEYFLHEHPLSAESWKWMRLQALLVTGSVVVTVLRELRGAPGGNGHHDRGRSRSSCFCSAGSFRLVVLSVAVERTVSSAVAGSSLPVLSVRASRFNILFFLRLRCSCEEPA
ncbi:hypothetical protein ACP3WT_22285 [Salmonella enterica]|uniref:hypothetical protein n=1 Tax=Salmonella enterica TaxID=28901 RepID=UPI0037A679BC